MIRRSLLSLIGLALSLSFALPSGAIAQATTGEVTGRVSDASGQVIPGATVTAKNVDTAFTRATTSNASGDYLLTLLPPGRYQITVGKTGFKKATRDVAVAVGTRQTVGFDLQVGAVTESVTVTAETPLVETTRSDLGGVVTSKDIANLPVLNRTFANLSIVMPEARPAGNFDPTKTRVGNFAMNGGDGRQIDVNVDGGDNKDNVVGSLLQNYAYESILEFQVLQHRWTAESGRAVGGVLNVITKSGTNLFSGSGLVGFRNQDLVSKDYFQKTQGAVKPAFERWEYGGSAGGPIIKDRLFFFAAFERFDEPSSETPVRSQAVFNELAAIPGSSPVQAIPTPYDDNLLTAKVDYRFSNRQTMFGRFAYQKNSSSNDQVANPATTDLTGGNSDKNTLYDAVVNHTLMLGGNRLNQMAFHYQDFSNEILEVTSDPIQIFPTVRTGPAPNTPQATLVRKYQLRDDFSMLKGSHSMKFGTNYIYTQLGGYFYFGAFGYELTWFNDPQTITGNPAVYPQGFATPGAVRLLNYFAGEASHDQTVNQLAFYAQDDWRVTQRLTLNLGLRWDANIGLLNDQAQNRTINILQQINDPRANAITGDTEALSKSTPSWTEFQPRLGAAYDLTGRGRTILRGGWGIFYDQIFQNLTIFSLSQSGPEIYSQILGFTNSAVGVGQLPGFRYGVDPLPPPPAFDFSALPVGSFGRINDPGFEDPVVYKSSIGIDTALGTKWALSVDYVHTEGRNEPRVQVINPQIRGVCDPTFIGSTPASPQCVAGPSTRYFDQSFVAAGLGVNRLGQINMIGSTNSSKFDSVISTVRGRFSRSLLSASYVWARSRAWGGQPVASYSGNGIAVDPDQQFLPGEFGPTRIDEPNRFVANAVFELAWGFQLAPIVQWASSRPYTPIVGFDINGDGLTNILDRLCEGTDVRAVFDARGNLPAIRALNPAGCTRTSVNTQRTGFVVNADGSVSERSARFFNVDLRVSKYFKFGARSGVRVYADFFNVFDFENLSFALRPEQSSAASPTAFMQPVSLAGPGFGPPVGRPFTASFGARVVF